MAAPGFREKILTTLLSHDDEYLTELGMKEIVFGIQLPLGARSNMCFVVQAVAVQLIEEIVVVAAGKHYMWVGQHLEIGKPIEEERGIVALGLRTWANKL
jgi:hypothetical protein